MKFDKYIGCDLHQATTVVAVLDAEGKVVMETIVATEAAAIIRFLKSLSGPLHITFEETTQAGWMYDVVRGYVSEAIVCDPRRNKLLGEGSKADKPDARKLAELLRAGLLRPVYHGHEATRQLKELVRGYETLSADTQRMMVRIKAIYRAHGIRTSGSAVYQQKQREQWLQLLSEPGTRQRVSWVYEELDHLRRLRKQAKMAMVAEGRKHQAFRLLRTIPVLRKKSVRPINRHNGFVKSNDATDLARDSRYLWRFLRCLNFCRPLFPTHSRRCRRESVSSETTHAFRRAKGPAARSH
jgi:hypothetical protein